MHLTEYQSTVFDNHSENAVEEEDNGGPRGRNLEINNTSNIKHKKQTMTLEHMEMISKGCDPKEETKQSDLEGLHHDQNEE